MIRFLILISNNLLLRGQAKIKPFPLLVDADFLKTEQLTLNK